MDRRVGTTLVLLIAIVGCDRAIQDEPIFEPVGTTRPSQLEEVLDSYNRDRAIPKLHGTWIIAYMPEGAEIMDSNPSLEVYSVIWTKFRKTSKIDMPIERVFLRSTKNLGSRDSVVLHTTKGVFSIPRRNTVATNGLDEKLQIYSNVDSLLQSRAFRTKLSKPDHEFVISGPFERPNQRSIKRAFPDAAYEARAMEPGAQDMLWTEDVAAPR